MKSIYRYFLIELLLLTTVNAQQIEFDGVVTAEEWQAAQQFTIGYEFSPSVNVPAPYTTEVYFKYDATHLYVGVIAEADMRMLRSSLRNRDEGYSDDHVIVGLDPYRDGRYMISLGANAAGSPLDLKFFPDGSDDTNYDVDFETKASEHPDAYHIEMKIPFGSLQFKNEAEMLWNVLLYRNTYTGDNKSENINFPIDLNNPCLPCQVETTIALKNIKPKKRFNLIPYTSGIIDGQRDGRDFKYGSFKPDAGVNGFIDLSNLSSLEFTINPDFSQVEADVSQIDVNNTFALFFPERRPYFNEGNELIDTEVNAVYTRAINSPLVSAKFINQGERNQIYWLTAYDENSPILIAGENQSYSGLGGAAFANVFKFKRSYAGGNNWGILTTSRIFKEGGQGHTFGLNMLKRFWKSYTLIAEWHTNLNEEGEADWIDSEDSFLGSTRALDGERLKGNALYGSLQRNTLHWNTEIEYEQYSPFFNTPLGFVTQNNVRFVGVEQNYQHFFPEKFWINTLNVGLGTEGTWNFQGLRKNLELNGGIRLNFKGNVRLSMGFNHNLNEEFEGYNFKHLSSLRVFSEYNPSENLEIGFFSGIGEGLLYDEVPEVGNSIFFRSWANIQWTPQLSSRFSIRYSELKEKELDRSYYAGYISRAQLNFQFSNNLSLRLIGEYNQFNESIFIQPLLQWNPTPFTIFYIGGANDYESDSYHPQQVVQSSQWYFKFQYAFGL
ncbi:MAG: hypothetical protein ACON42_06045 [Flavobacteriaceae bacterium]